MKEGPTEREHEEASRRLLEDFSAWAGGAVSVEDARRALDYKWASGDARLTLWTHPIVDDLLLGYLPAKVLAIGQEARELAGTICRFFEFLDATGAMSVDSDPAADLVTHIEDHLSEFEELMADPSTGGNSKRILVAMLKDGVDIEDAEAVSDWIEAFNAGPIEDRDAVLGPLGELGGVQAGIELPPRPPVDVALARQGAAGAPIFSKLTALARYMGEGRRLTERGNVRLAEAAELVALLETGDVVDGAIGDRVFKTRSSVDLVWLDLIVWWARTVRAVKVRHKRMSATKAWLGRASRDPLEVMRDVAAVIFETGP